MPFRTAIHHLRGLYILQLTDEILKVIEEISQEDEKYKDFKVLAEEELTYY
ncbi:hypothetical protein [Sporosarcina sp. GW1-11]|uniref:hypothetical protein n=1 Tax=Sporosarcina sp. GW1-11 TaxID=2899126 RepID=UPI0029554470|nr:hypothetical protein [Sporosarcina sp. GW1-11]